MSPFHVGAPASNRAAVVCSQFGLPWPAPNTGDEITFHCEIDGHECEFRVYFWLREDLAITGVELTSLDYGRPTSAQCVVFQNELTAQLGQFGNAYQRLASQIWARHYGC